MTKRILSLMLLVLTFPILANEPPATDCLIEPNRVVNLGTREEGVIDAISVERGDFVEAGQVLAHLDADVERASVELARVTAHMTSEIEAKKVTVSFSQRKQGRHGELFRKKVLPGHEFDEAKTEAALAAWELRKAEENQRLAKLELQRAESILNRRIIKSPVKGAVVERFLSLGESVKDQPIVKIAELDPLKVEVILPVSLYGSIKPGRQAQVVPEAPVSGNHLAKVTIVDPVIDAASGTFGVRLELPNPDYKLPGGLKCKIAFMPDQKADQLQSAVSAEKHGESRGPASSIVESTTQPNALKRAAFVR